MTLSAEILADSPVGYWKLDDAGADAVDSSGNAYTCTDVNTPTHSATSLLGDGTGAAFSFDSASSEYTKNTSIHTALEGGNDGTIEFIGKRSASGSIIEVGFTGKWGVAMFSDGNLYFLIDGRYPNVALSGTGAHHIIAVFDHTGATFIDRVKVYIDGSLATMSNAGSGDPTIIPASMNEFQIGGNTAEARYSTGTIDEVAVYSTVLDATRVAAHYAAYSSTGSTTQPAYAYAQQ